MQKPVCTSKTIPRLALRKRMWSCAMCCYWTDAGKKLCNVLLLNWRRKEVVQCAVTELTQGRRQWLGPWTRLSKWQDPQKQGTAKQALPSVSWVLLYFNHQVRDFEVRLSPVLHFPNFIHVPHLALPCHSYRSGPFFHSLYIWQSLFLIYLSFANEYHNFFLFFISNLIHCFFGYVQ